MYAESTGLNANVLVLNRLYMAIRVITARRAFSLLSRDLAEVVSPSREGTAYTSYDFDSWTELSGYRELFTPDYDWVKTVRMDIAVPKIIRLLGYDRLPKQTVKLNRRDHILDSPIECHDTEVHPHVTALAKKVTSVPPTSTHYPGTPASRRTCPGPCAG